MRLLLAGERELTAITLSIEIDGQAADAVWEQSITAIFRYCDLDQNGSLSERESQRIPSPLYLRRLLWGSVAAPSVLDDPLNDIDTDQSQFLSLDEVKSFYRKSEVGVEASFGTSISSEHVSDELTKRLDSNHDQQISSAELAALPKLLSSLDLNEDELLAPSEIVAGTLYPGTAGSTRIAPWADQELIRRPGELLVIKLPADITNTNWAKEVVTHFGKNGAIQTTDSSWNADLLKHLDSNADGSIGATELVAILDPKLLPVFSAQFRNGSDAEALESQSALAIHDPWPSRSIQLRARIDTGSLQSTVDASVQRLVNLFEEADVERAESVRISSLEASKFNALQRSFDFLDRDGDRFLTRSELDVWVKLIDTLVRAQVLVRIIDYRAGVFSWLDLDGSGSLSLRECRSAVERAAKSGLAEGDQLNFTQLPRLVDITVSRGPAQSHFAVPSSTGPAWFAAMDRNNDGDLSAKEWSLPLEIFERTDTDQDGLLTPLEAKALRRGE